MDFKYKITLEGNNGYESTMQCMDFDMDSENDLLTVKFSEKKVGTYRLGLYTSWVIEEL